VAGRRVPCVLRWAMNHALKRSTVRKGPFEAQVRATRAQRGRHGLCSWSMFHFFPRRCGWNIEKTTQVTEGQGPRKAQKQENGSRSETGSQKLKVRPKQISFLTGREPGAGSAAISGKWRVWSSNAESPNPGEFFHTPVASRRADTGSPSTKTKCRWRESRSSNGSDSDQGGNSTARQDTGRTTRPVERLAIVSPWESNVKESNGEPWLLSIGEVAGRLRICRRTLEREINRGRFPRPLKIGKASRWEVGDVVSYIARLTQQRGPEASAAP
jgi:predicted DNA-binding transcriptional regulator AlpA